MDDIDKIRGELSHAIDDVGAQGLNGDRIVSLIDMLIDAKLAEAIKDLRDGD